MADARVPDACSSRAYIPLETDVKLAIGAEAKIVHGPRRLW